MLAWEHAEIKKQLAIIDGEKAPDLIITNAYYLHAIYKKWMTGNIWVRGDRIVYVGQAMPEQMDGTEVFDATGKKIVPGYIEPHVHPFQLYSPWTFAEYASMHGTTTFIADNLGLLAAMEDEACFSLLEELKRLPFAFYWWARFDAQTELQNEAERFGEATIEAWIKRSDVLMGGELSGWPRLLNGDEKMFASVKAAKRAGMKVEGHYPGASERTLARMKLLGTDGDHESMTVEEVEARLLHGYGVTLRHSSIRPDLPDLLKDIVQKDLNVYDHLMMTTDGSTPGFHKDGVMDKCIRVALEAGVPPIDAYLMASYNVARYYDIADLHGVIATGRYATLNVLENEAKPEPTDVLSKGVWVKREGRSTSSFPKLDTSVFPPLSLPFDLKESDFDFNTPIGIEMVNDVITKLYEVTIETTESALSNDHDESYLMLLDRNGKWRVNTMLKGFATDVQGFASSYSLTGDILIVGKNKVEMRRAFEEVKRLGGGMVLTENGETIAEIPLPIGGGLSAEPMEILIEQEAALKEALQARGYRHEDAVYTFLFLQSTHLPYIRITQAGIYDVMKREILIPKTERR